MLKRSLALAIVLALLAFVAFGSLGHRSGPIGATRRPLAPAIELTTRHFAIASTASPEKTRLVAERVEILHDAWVAFFGDSLGPDRDKSGLQLMLFKDRPEFRAHNDSAAWAEAFYRPPVCRAYYEDGAANPYHWMLHEVVHQLNNEVAHFRLRRWTNEGLATYFSTSLIEGGRLVPGKVDPATYPIWWVGKMELSGDLRADIANRRIIPLRKIIEETDALTVDDDVNLHYIEYWSLTHFLIHFDQGKYAAGFRQLVAEGGSLAAFEQKIGPVEAIEREWYVDLREEVDAFGPTPVLIQ